MTVPIDLGMLETLNPAIISAVALALGAVSLLGTDHPIIKRVTWPVILLMVGLGAFSVFLQAHQEYGSERQKAQERQNNEREKLVFLLASAS